MSNTQVLVKIPPGDLQILKIPEQILVSSLKQNHRVLLKSGTEIVEVLPPSVSQQVKSMQVTKHPNASYSMIGGMSKQIQELREIIELPIKNPEIFKSLGVSPGSGVLLYGPPGTGKSLLARCVAGQCGCSFISISGAEIVSKYIGEGSKMVRQIFQMARQEQPSIIFIDEIDSVGGKRNSSNDAEQEVQRTMMELLTQLDGFTPNDKIKLIIATNRVDMLDPALLRPGRIDRMIEMPLPDQEGRVEILKIHSKKMNLSRNVEFDKISREMNGANGADCETVCNEAGIMALRDKRTCVRQEDFMAAVKKVMNKEWVKDEEVLYVL